MITKTDLQSLVKYAKKNFRHSQTVVEKDIDLLLINKNQDNTINSLCLKLIWSGIYVGLTINDVRLYEGVLTTPQEIEIFKNILSSLNSQPKPITS